MAPTRNKLSTPALLPWIPPGKPKESSSNVFVNKKNSGEYDFGSSIASSTVFNQPKKKSVSLNSKFWSPKKNSRKLTLGPEKERRIESLLNSSVNSEAEKELLRNKILGIFDEAEENDVTQGEYEKKNRKRRKSDPGNTSKNQSGENERQNKKYPQNNSNVDKIAVNSTNDNKQRRPTTFTKHEKERSRSRSRSRRKHDNHDGNEEGSRHHRERSTSPSRNHERHNGNIDKSHQDTKPRNLHNNSANKNTRVGNKHYTKDRQTNKSSNSDESSGFGSYGFVEDLKDRNSVKFIESYDLYAKIPSNKNSDLGFHEPDFDIYHEENQDIFMEDIENDPRYRHISTEVEIQTDQHPDYNKPTIIHAMPNIIFDQEAPYNISGQTNNANNSDASSRMGFASTFSLPFRQRGDDPNLSIPEAWIIYPKGVGANGSRSLGVQSRNVESILSVPRSYTAKPINFANSIGSRLKQSFANINSIKQDTPVQQFTHSDQENLVSPEPLTEEQRWQKRQRSALIYGASACCGIVLLIIVVVGIALLATFLGQDSTYNEGENPIPQRFPRDNDTSMCFEGSYKNLSDSWRKITGRPPDDGLYRCDKRDGFRKEGWYRFVEKSGSYLSTNPPAFIYSENKYEESCGTNYIGWMNGKHPTISEGLVEREFCFQTKTGECQWRVTSKVRTCPIKNQYTENTETFYVYYLKFPPEISCNSAYCSL